MSWHPAQIEAKAREIVYVGGELGVRRFIEDVYTILNPAWQRAHPGRPLPEERGLIANWARQQTGNADIMNLIALFERVWVLDSLERVNRP